MPSDPAGLHWAKPPTRAGFLPVHMFTVTRPHMIDGKRVKDGGSSFEVAIPGCYCDGPAARALLEHLLPDGYAIDRSARWSGDISTVDHERWDLDNYGDPHPGAGMAFRTPA